MRMWLKNTLICMTTISVLSACAALEKRAEETRKIVTAKLETFSNQLIKEDQPYATLRFYPPVSRHYGYGTLDPTPINIIKFDKTMLSGYEEEFGFLSSYQALQTPHIPLKVPTGSYSFIAGVANSSIGYVKFNDVNFEAGKHYILKTVKYDRKKRRSNWQIYEYTLDTRFGLNERESVILGQPVSDQQIDGHKKDIL
ncbi:hypothetical protein [Neisseria wadsworthii]|uniref:hypothetical protein n=1 Tax=Neisseria wadsworthii TaxID=607711 RepID=UPI000D30BE53|nr:hypothetical protein [Neisseria wadsworthii]